MRRHDLAILRGRLRVLSVIFERDRRTKRFANDVVVTSRANENRRVPAAAPRFFQSLDRNPSSLLIAPLRAHQSAVAVDSVRDDVVEKIVCVTWRVDDL